MMGILVPETCWAYKKYNKTISGIKFQMAYAGQMNHMSAVKL